MTPDKDLEKRLRDLLEYNPETGIFRWRVNRRPATLAGDEAGYIRADGFVILMVDRRIIPAHRLAWFFMRGEWPPKNTLPHFHDGDRSNTAWANIDYRHRRYVDSAGARYARAWRRRRPRKPVNLQPDEAVSNIPDITALEGQWLVHLPGTPRNHIAHRAKTFTEARDWYVERLRVLALIQASPPIPPSAADVDIRAGQAHDAITLLEARAWLYYDPDEGGLYYRQRPSRAGLRRKHTDVLKLAAGDRADQPGTASRSVVLFARRYPAHGLAVLIQRGFWPNPKAIRHRNGNRADNRWDNLDLSRILEPTA